MSGYVIDCSIAISALFEDESEAIADRLVSDFSRFDAVAPSIWPLEVTNAFLMAVRRGRVPTAKMQEYIAEVEAYPIRILPVPMLSELRSVYNLASDFGLSAYDASYIHTARKLDLGIATLDDKLRNVATHLRIPVFVGIDS